MRKVIAIAIISLLIAACTSIDCPVQNTVYTVYNLKKADGTADTLLTDTLWIRSTRADGQEALLLNKLYGPSAFHFDLGISYTQPEDVLYMEVVNNVGGMWRDTIRIKKENTAHFESVDCQASYFHTITEVNYSRHLIDSIVINNPHVTYDTTEPHFYLYLKARR